MKDGSQQMLFKNGDFWTTKKRGIWQINQNISNQQPFLMSPESPLKDSNIFDFPELRVDSKIDPETGRKVYKRNDQVITTISEKNYILVKHADETYIKTFRQGKEIHEIIENPKGFASVFIRQNTQKQNQWKRQSGVTTIGQGGMAASQGDTDIMERSVDGNIIKVIAPNNTATITGHKERRELPGFDFYDVFVWIIQMDDGSAIKIQEDGEVVFITADERRRLNKQEKENAKPDGQDVAYHLQLFSPKDERKMGVYTVELDKNILWTFDNERNYFELNSNGQVKQRIAISFIKDDPLADLTPRFKTQEYIDKENLFLPPPDNWIPPRLFVISNNNTGYEILNQEQLDHEFYIKNKDKKSKMKIERLQNYDCDYDHELISYFKKMQDLMKKPIHNFQKLLPQIVCKQPQTIPQRKQPKLKIYTQKNYQKYKPFGENERKILKNDLEKYEKFVNELQAQKESYKIVQKTKEEKENEAKLQQTILAYLRKKRGITGSLSNSQDLEMNSSELSYQQ